jgi:starch-binding outer membrane protein, SusD/RagB family
MKTIRKTLIKYLGAGLIVLSLGSCVDYLNKAPEVTLKENDIFTKFISFQGFVEDIYQNVVDVTIGSDAEMNWNYGDDVVCTYTDMIEPHFARGDYWK